MKSQTSVIYELECPRDRKLLLTGIPLLFTRLLTTLTYCTVITLQCVNFNVPVN